MPATASGGRRRLRQQQQASGGGGGGGGGALNIGFTILADDIDKADEFLREVKRKTDNNDLNDIMKNEGLTNVGDISVLKSSVQSDSAW